MLMKNLKIKIPRSLWRALKQSARRQGRSTHDIVVAALEQDLLGDCPTLESRLQLVEEQLRTLRLGAEMASPFCAESIDSEVQVRRDARQRSYESWLVHFTEHPERCEPGRTAHEMAALKAAAL